MSILNKIKEKVSDIGSTVAGNTMDLNEWLKTIPEILHGYADQFNPDEMWEKLKTQAASAGQELVLMVLTMYYTIRDRIKGTNVVEDIPMMDVLLLAGAIAYFVCPADTIPDFLPGVGYSDDLAALTFAYKKAFSIFSVAAKGTAMEKTAELLGDNFNPDSVAKMTQNLISK